MPYLPEDKRIKPTIYAVEDFLYELGVPSGDGEKIIIEGIELEINKQTRTGRGNPMRLVMTFDHPGASRYINKLKQTVWKELKQYYDIPWKDIMAKSDGDKQMYKALPFGYKADDTYTILSFNVIRRKEAVKGATPADIQEEGTTIILNAALKDNVTFSTDDKKKKVFVKRSGTTKPIQQDKLYKSLEKLFGPYKKRIEDWLWTYYQQNKVFMNEYGKIQWDPFVYGDRSFTDFFREHMDRMERESGIKAGNYTTWNPSDIWAVRGMDSVRKELDKALKVGTLIEMNSKLIHLMESNELMGISLKMIKSGADAHVKLHNAETSSALKALGKVHLIEEYDMNDIHFRYNNIWEGDSTSVLTVVKLGPGDKYEINISRSGNNIGFNTKVKGAVAQAGQTPIDMIVDILKGIRLPDNKSFSKSHNDYPQTIDDLREDALKYQEMYNSITKGKSAPSYVDFEYYMEGVYNKNKRTAIIKLMQLTFWYVALLKYSRNTVESAEFWTDLLYTGMKIKPGREFAPHAKIS